MLYIVNLKSKLIFPAKTYISKHFEPYIFNSKKKSAHCIIKSPKIKYTYRQKQLAEKNKILFLVNSHSPIINPHQNQGGPERESTVYNVFSKRRFPRSEKKDRRNQRVRENARTVLGSPHF